MVSADWVRIPLVAARPSPFIEVEGSDLCAEPSVAIPMLIFFLQLGLSSSKW